MRKPRPYNQAFVLDYGWINLMDTLTRFFQTTLQLAVVGLVWLVSDLMVRFAHLPVSSGVIKTGMVERGAKWVLGELVFFFIPIMVSVLQYRDLLLSEGWRLVLTIAVGTALVMISTALTLNFCYRWKRRLHKKLHA